MSIRPAKRGGLLLPPPLMALCRPETPLPDPTCDRMRGARVPKQRIMLHEAMKNLKSSRKLANKMNLKK
jgi:hypothetical protein